MKNKPKNLDMEHYGWCRKNNHGVFTLTMGKNCWRCKEERERKAKGLCIARFGHGPGHQSKSYCDIKGKHKVHHCIYGCYKQEAWWTGPNWKLKFSGYFDESPDIEKIIQNNP